MTLRRRFLRATAALAFAAFGFAAVLAAPAAAQIRGPHEERVKEVKDLARQGDVEAVKKIVGYLEDKHPFPRDAAFLALIGLKDAQAIEWLATEGLTRASNPDVRADIIEALMVLRAKEAAPALRALLGRDERNRALIADALAEVGTAAEDAELLLKAARSWRDGRARAAALEAALRLDRGRAAEAAKIAEGADDPAVRVGTIRALVAADAPLGVTAAVAAIEERRAAWEKKKERERVGPWQPAFAAMRALVGLAERAPHKEKIVAAIDAMIPLLEHERGRMKHEVHRALIALTGKKGIADDRAAWEYWWYQNRARF